MNTDQEQEKVPLFPGWKQWYILVLVVLAVLVVLFYFFTKHFA